EAGQVLVDGVVDQLVDEVVQAARGGVGDVVIRPLADVLGVLEVLDAGGVVFAHAVGRGGVDDGGRDIAAHQGVISSGGSLSPFPLREGGRGVRSGPEPFPQPLPETGRGEKPLSGRCHCFLSLSQIPVRKRRSVTFTPLRIRRSASRMRRLWNWASSCSST